MEIDREAEHKDLTRFLCSTYQQYQHFHALQSDVLLRLNSLLLDVISVRGNIYVRAVKPMDTVHIIPANPLAARPRGNQYVATAMNIRPEEHDDLRLLPFDERSGRVIKLENLKTYSRTPFNESEHASEIIVNRQLSDFLMLSLLRYGRDFKVQDIAKVLGKSPNLIQELWSDVKLHYLQPMVFSETVVKNLECKFCRVCNKISCFAHFPSPTKSIIEDSFAGNKVKTEDKSTALLQKVDPKGWKNQWRRWQLAVGASGLWLAAHRCIHPASCARDKKNLQRFDPGQAEKFIAKIMQQKGVENPCLLSLFADITCYQAKSIFEQISSMRPPQAVKREYLADTFFPEGDKKDYTNEVKIPAEPSTCSCTTTLPNTSPCLPQNCPCLDNKPESRKLCEKYCECSDACMRKFLGCNCKYGKCEGMKCVCVANNRECDPDVCISCCACVRIPKDLEAVVRKKNKWSSWVVCLNTNIQSLRHKRTAIAQSVITGAGYGLFTLEPLKPCDFITEYTGEMITEAETIRRGIIYDLKEQSYIFSINQELCIDAVVMGNKMRFANHRSAGEDNCVAKNMRVMGSTCVALYAKTDIPAGSELFFDYQYKKGDVKYSWFVSYNKALEERKKPKKKPKS